MFSLAARRGISIKSLLLFAFGIFLVLISSALPEKIFSMHISSVASEIGAFFCASLVVHWMFETHSKQELMEDITKFVLSNSTIATSGIVGYVNSMYRISYEEPIINAKELIVGFNYSNKFLEENKEILKNRAKKRQTTSVLVLNQNSDAAAYLKNIRDYNNRLDMNQAENFRMLDYINSVHSSDFNVYKHSCILKYSFFLTESMVWVRFYKNLDQNSLVPAIMIKSPSELYTIFRTDIELLIKNSELCT